MTDVVRLTRRAYFSSGHRYWLGNLTPAENQALFGKWASPYNHGHNYVLDVCIAGEADAVTGMVFNLAELKVLIERTVLSKLDQKSINDEVEDFRDRAPSLENLVKFIRDQLLAVLSGHTLCALKLEESPLLWVKLDLENGPESIVLTRVYEFAAAHRLHVASLSTKENAALFGKCAHESGHGHNYVLEVSVSGPIDPTTGMMIEITELDRVVTEQVIDRYDHKNLNVDVPELRGKNPTTEIVCQQIFARLSGALAVTLESVRLKETERNIFEVRRGDS